MRSLVIGASGQVGEHCLAALGPSGVGTYREHARPGMIALDIRDRDAFDRLLAERRPEVVYLSACVANVDFCETNPDTTYKTNVKAVTNAVELANRHRCKLVYLSSEYLFDGTAGPYDEDAPTRPLQVYGWQKLAAEHAIAAFADDWLIVRTAVVFSWESQGKNFLYRLRGSLLEGKEIRVPVDQISSPTYAPDLVQAMIELVDRGERGVFNICGPRVVSRYDFALEAAEAFGLDATRIVPVTTPELEQPAQRPLRAGLTVTKVERTLGRPMPDFTAGLREMAHAIH